MTLALVVTCATTNGWWQGHVCAQEKVSQQSAQSIQHNLLLLPSAQAARRLLAREASIVWEQQPLRAGLRDLERSYGISIWLDRRIDPSQPVDFRLTKTASLDERCLSSCLEQIALQVNAHACLIENVVYVGPTGCGEQLQYSSVVLHNALADRFPEAQPQGRPLAWSELTTPDSLLRNIASDWSVSIDGQLPHDLMHAGSLAAPCSLATQLTLVAGGFGQSVVAAAGASGLQLAAIPDGQPVTWTAVYPRSSLNAEKLTPRTLLKLQARWGGGARARAGVEQVSVSGPTDFHLALLAPKVETAPAADLEKTPWKLELERKPVGVVLEFIAGQAGLELAWDPQVTQAAKDMLLTLSVEDATIDQLLSEIGTASGLQFRRTGRRVEVSPLETSPKQP